MHATRRAAQTARRRVRGRRATYAICGLPRTAALPVRTGVQGFLAWPSGAVCLALALCAFWVVRSAPPAPPDPAGGAMVVRFTFEDFANASR